MRKLNPGTNYFFVDESGDPTFYDKQGNYIVGTEGCSQILILGFISTHEPELLRKAIMALHDQVKNDKYLQQIPSFEKTAIGFHAKDDAPEIRYLVYNLLSQLDFRAELMVARKIEKNFRSSFKSKTSVFYDHLISLLFQNSLHKYEVNKIYFSRRGSRSRQAPLVAAIGKAIKRFENRHSVAVETKIEIQAQSPAGEPCLSIIDYINWAVYRAYTKNEMRYYRSIESKVSYLADLNDWEKHPKNRYHKKNPFDINKATPL